MNTHETRETLQDVELSFMEQWYQGEKPTLDQYTARYPQFADELSEFMFLFLLSENMDIQEADEVLPETLQAIEQGLKVSDSQARSLVERLQEANLTPAQLSNRLDIPPTIIMWLNQRGIVELPRRFVAALAREIKQTTSQVLDLIRPIDSMPSPAMQYRATGQPTSTHNKIRTFEEALGLCYEKKLLNDAQFQKWLGKGA